MDKMEYRKYLKEFIDSNYSPTFCTKPFTEICNTARGGMKLCCETDINTLQHEDMKDTTYVHEFFNNENKHGVLNINYI